MKNKSGEIIAELFRSKDILVPCYHVENGKIIYPKTDEEKQQEFLDLIRNKGVNRK